MYENLVDIINKDISNKQGKYIANKYYYRKNNNNDKSNEVVTTDANGNVVTLKLDKSNDINVNYFKLLVNQKIDYLLSKNPTLKRLENYTINNIVNMLEQLMLKASIDGRSWLHLYVKDNKLEHIVIYDSEIIPTFDESDNLISLIRYYKINKDDIKVEIWSMSGVETAIINENKIINYENTTHCVKEIEYNDDVVDREYYNLQFIPFIPFYNNRDSESDIVEIQGLLDAYDSISSGFVDNIDKFQEALIKLKGFTGDTEFLDETMKNLKRYKMVGLPCDGDMDYVKVEIPVEARKVILELLKENIFKLGRGFDEDNLGDGNITNIVIKSRYSKLDGKCNGAERQLKKFYETFVKMQNMFYNKNESFDIDCNRTQLFNVSELISDCVNAIQLVNNNLLSRETLIKNNPWVVDYKKELKLIENEAKSKEDDKSTGQNLPNDNNSTGQNPTNDDKKGDNLI